LTQTDDGLDILYVNGTFLTSNSLSLPSFSLVNNLSKVLLVGTNGFLVTVVFTVMARLSRLSVLLVVVFVVVVVSVVGLTTVLVLLVSVTTFLFGSG